MLTKPNNTNSLETELEGTAPAPGFLGRIIRWRFPVHWYRRLTVATAFAIWALIVLGGSVRVTDSGEGCGNSWPMCHGHLLPSLEYHELVEWNHRFFAVLGGFLMVVTCLVTLLWYRRPRHLFWLAIAAGVTYIMQAVLGGLTVLFKVGHTWTALHMGNSMLLLASVILLAVFARVSIGVGGQGSGVRDKTPNNPQPTTYTLQPLEKWLRGVVLVALVWTYIALFSGSQVVGADATLACPAWPQCSETQLLPNTDSEWVNFGHRLAVGISDIMFLALGVMVWRSPRRTDKRLMNVSRVLAFLYVSQVFLGAFTIWLKASPAIKGAHLALAAATWGALVVMATFIWLGPAPESSEPGSGTRRRKWGFNLRTLDTGVGSEKPGLATTIRNYVGLMRPQVIPLLLVPTIASMLIAAVQHPTQDSLLTLILLTSLGGILATGGAHALNQYLDRDLDARMRRTRRRAIVSGRITPERALAFGIALTSIAIVQLWLTVNPVAALLSLGGNLFYVFVYTMWLKRTSPQNIVIGGAAGAVPPLVGWAAVTGRVDLPAILFFAIIFFWTPAHFWALSLVRQEDYKEAGIPMLPVVRGEAYTRLNILLYAVLLLAATLLPFLLNALSWVYLTTALSLGLLFVFKAVKLWRHSSTALAWRLFKFSNTYLAVLYAMMVLDRLLALGWMPFV